MSEAFNACGHEPAQLHNEAICIFCYRDRLGAATAAMQHDHLDDVAILRRFRREFTALAAQNAAPQSVAGAAPIVSEQARRCEWCGEIAHGECGCAVEVYAARYRWLREQHWDDSVLCVTTHPKQNLRLGAYCPSGELLDAAIDAARKERV